MVHALREAHRVLKPNGLLLDLRPAASHRRAGLGEGRRWKQVGVMRESFDDDIASDRAVSQVVRDGFFNQKSVVEFDLDRVMDTMQDFRVWLDDFAVDINYKSPSHDWLYQRVARALKKKRAGTKIAVRGLMRLGVLIRINP
jgi:hypothetical protein